jgi:hypothetical protein
LEKLMKSSHLRLVAAVLAAIGLAACGGKAAFEVSGTIFGLSNSGLVLSQGASTVSPEANATVFSFPDTVD